MGLQHYWAGQGCLIWQPYYTQVGAGTMNPATALRVLGPEPWRVAYVEPSIRPDDGRYGENPNRMQMHYQFQVILKPDPGNPQDLYLKSLEALGIDLRRHDIRFVEDNWESPALGAWGLGWEVWLDGQEITQFTYFQQSGGQVLDPVSVELTYGLDRIAIALQGVDSFRDIRWNEALTAGDVNLQAEQEHSRYYFEVADVARLQEMYDLFEAEANVCLAQGMVLPAHDYVLKCSHTFNVLDTRGSIGVTERQAFFARMRDLSRRVAEAYLEQRQRLEYPWLNQQHIADRGGEERHLASPPQPPDFPAPFLLEIGTEELPVADLESALEQLHACLPVLLQELRLVHGEWRILGTPRRLVVYIEEVAPYQTDLEQVIKGPPAERAYTPDGHPTPAAEGFARSKGVALSDLQVHEIDGGRYVVARLRQAGRPSPAVLAEALPGLLASLRFEKAMRWNATNVAFSRPIRWLLALFGDQVVPFEFAGVRSGNLTRGLRFRQPEQFPIDSPGEYFATLAAQGIILDVAERKARIRAQVDELAAQVKGEVVSDADLLEEVANLVEAPASLRGTFDASHLGLPREVLVSVMKVHQRYFPVEQQGRLLPHFIAVSNLGVGDGDAPGDLSLAVQGNEHVIRARFADAAYFVREDLKRPLHAYLPQLATLTFQVRLGSMLDKTHRVRGLVGDLAPLLDMAPGETDIACRAAELCKADLTTRMVVEMTALQGVMGRYYAAQSGEPPEVAQAIFEHYLPRFNGDVLPQSRPGMVVGLADRLDTLAGLFAVGLAPTGNKDPFAQRRAALGLLQNLIGRQIDLDLRAALELAADRLPQAAQAGEGQGWLAGCLEFIRERLRNILLDQGRRYDVVDAVLAAQGHNPLRSARAVHALGIWVTRPDWHTILPAYARCVRITRDFTVKFPLDVQGLSHPAEHALHQAYQGAEARMAGGQYQAGSVDGLLEAFLPMIPHINRFFDEVLVMTDDPALRENRLALLQRIAALADGVADLSKLEGF